MTATADTPLARSTARDLPIRLSQAAVVLFLGIKLYFAIVAPLIGDEAYYWMWGQKLAWSYFDHPPLHAWLLRLMDLIFGWNVFSVRILTWITLAGTLVLFWLWAKRLKAENPAAWFWPTAAIYLAAPLFFSTTSIAFHDHLLAFLCLLSAHLFLTFAEKWEMARGSFAWLYAAAAVLGLAVLTKYNGVLLGVGVAIFFIVHKPLRPLWRSAHLYLAALLSIAMQAPVLWWNATEGFASYKFHLSERWGRPLLQFNPIFVGEFILYAVLVIGPFLIPAIIGIIRRPLAVPFADRARVLALSTFFASTLVMGFLSFFVEIYFYWNIVAFLLLMPLLVGWLRSRILLGLHITYGVAVCGLLTYHVTAVPIGFDWTFVSAYGWPEVAQRIEAIEKDHKVGIIAATRYTTAAQLGFAMHDPDVTTFSPRHDQYDFWFDAAAHKGEDALVVTDEHLGTGGFDKLFDKITKLETVPIVRYGTTIYRPSIYLAQGFHGTTGK